MLYAESVNVKSSSSSSSPIPREVGISFKRGGGGGSSSSSSGVFTPSLCRGCPRGGEKRLCTFLLAMMHFLEVSFGEKNHIFASKKVWNSARIRADFDVFVGGIAKLKEEEDARSKFAVRHLKCIFFRKATEGELFLSSPFFFSASKIGVSEVCGVIFRSSSRSFIGSSETLKPPMLHPNCWCWIRRIFSRVFFWGGGIRDPRLHFGVFPKVNRSPLSIAGGGGGGGLTKREMKEIKASCCSRNRVTSSF